MPIETQQNKQLHTIRLEGMVDIASAAQLKAVLLEAIADGGALRLSLESVTCLDVTAVQLLWAANQAARTAGVAIDLDGPLPDSLAQQLAAAGFSGFPLS